jgi:hypothetical protein
MDVSDAAVWQRALDDSNLTEANARLYFFDASAPPTTASGDTFAPGQSLSRGWPPISDADRQSANAARGAFRIVVDTREKDPILLWALVRHELEHCRQYQRYGTSLSQLGHAIDETLERLHGRVPGVYTLYNVMPSESDANAAASGFARRTFGSDACDRLLSDDWAVLIQQQSPAAIDDVGLRQVCFAAVHAQALKQSARLGPAGIKPLLDALAPDIAERWIDIARDTRLQALARAALDSSPSWEPTKSLTLAAYRRACALAASEA